MSAPADPTGEMFAAALAPGMTLQDVTIRLAKGVCAAYAAYNNGSNLKPSLAGYHAFKPIYVYEASPNITPWSVAATARRAAADALTASGSRVPRQPAAYAVRPGESSAPCTGPTPIGTPVAGPQLFGFTATADDRSHNILALRGTVTLEEAGYDLLGWGDNTACLLPSQSSQQRTFGLVNSYLYAFYVDTDLVETSLAASCLDAIRKTSAETPNVPWYLGAHSLGGAMLSLAALDGVVSNLLRPNTLAVTFGSLHVGDDAWARAYKDNGPTSLRIANLCDFVPSMVSLEPVIPTDPYVHVGIEATFVWQTWDDWGNHSLANIYMPMVESHWSVIRFGKRTYPQ